MAMYVGKKKVSPFIVKKINVSGVEDENNDVEGEILITENGKHNVAQYAIANVNVPKENKVLISKEFSENGTFYASDDGADGYSEITINVESEASINTLAKFIAGEYTEITAKDLEGITKIAHYAFYGRPFTKVELCEGIAEIGNYVFCACSSMVECILSNTVESIGNCSFQNCTALESLKIPSSVNSLGSQCFNGCMGLKTVILNEGLPSISQSCFYNCRALENISIPATVTTIGGYAFVNCIAITDLVFPDGLSIHDQYSFDGCAGLKKVVFGSGATSIKTNAFRGCSAVEVYDFRKCKQIVTLATEFSLAHATGCKIVVPDELYDEWSTGTNWVAQNDVVWVKESEYVEE